MIFWMVRMRLADDSKIIVTNNLRLKMMSTGCEMAELEGSVHLAKERLS